MLSDVCVGIEVVAENCVERALDLCGKLQREHGADDVRSAVYCCDKSNVAQCTDIWFSADI